MDAVSGAEGGGRQGPDVPRRFAVTLAVLASLQALWIVPLRGLDTGIYVSFLPWLTSTAQATVFDPHLSMSQLRVLSFAHSGLAYFPAAVAVVLLARRMSAAIEARLRPDGWSGIEAWSGRVMLVLTAIMARPFLVLLAQRPSHLVTDTSFTGFVLPNAAGITAVSALYLLGAGLISRSGLGNGVLLVLALQSLDSWFRPLAAHHYQMRTGGLGIEHGLFPALAVFVLVVLCGIAASAAVQIRVVRSREASRRARAPRTVPLALCPAGVWPVLIASVAADLLVRVNGGLGLAVPPRVFAPGELPHLGLTLVLIAVFGHLCASAGFDPQRAAATLRSSGAFLPGTRPGDATAARLAARAAKVQTAGIALLVLIGLAASLSGRLFAGLVHSQVWSVRLEILAVPAALWSVFHAVRACRVRVPSPPARA